MASPPTRPEEVAPEFPVFPLTGALLLPRAKLPLNIFEPRYLAMVEDALAGGRVIGMIQPEPGRPATPRWLSNGGVSPPHVEECSPAAHRRSRQL